MTPSAPEDAESPVAALAAAHRQGTRRPTATVETYLDRIAAQDDDLTAFVTVTEDLAREGARSAAVTAGERASEETPAEAATGSPTRSPLHGVPVAVKDLSDHVAGVPTSFGCALFADYDPGRTAVAVQRLRDAGAVILGKTNTPEFGHAGVTDNEYVGPTANPFDRSRNAGGSSGGSAAAVAAGLAPAAIGSDAGGSVRIPAACCGVVGHKPSYGLVPMDPRPNAFGGHTHHVVRGPLTRTVGDAALLLAVLAGPHRADPESVPVDVDFRAGADAGAADGIEGWSVAYSPALDAFAVDDAVATVVEDALAGFEAAGATVDEVTVDHGLSLGELADGVRKTFATDLEGVAETLREAEGLDLREHAEDLSDTFVTFLEEAERITTRDVAATGIPRTRVYDAVEDVLAAHDVLVTPTLGSTAPPLEMAEAAYREWTSTQVLTWPFNWTGHPVVSVPAGIADDGLPVGLQVVGRRYADDEVLRAAAAFERERPWQEPYPR